MCVCEDFCPELYPHQGPHEARLCRALVLQEIDPQASLYVIRLLPQLISSQICENGEGGAEIDPQLRLAAATHLAQDHRQMVSGSEQGCLAGFCLAFCLASVKEFPRSLMLCMFALPSLSALLIPF